LEPGGGLFVSCKEKKFLYKEGSCRPRKENDAKFFETQAGETAVPVEKKKGKMVSPGRGGRKTKRGGSFLTPAEGGYHTRGEESFSEGGGENEFGGNGGGGTNRVGGEALLRLKRKKKPAISKMRTPG